MEISFLVGKIISIDTFRKMSSGETVPMLKVRSFLDGSDVEIPWLPIGPDQKMPMINQEVLYYTYGGRSYRMVAFHGNNPDWIRKGKFGLNEGEFVMQSDSGLGYVKGAQDGSIEVASGDAISHALFSDEGVSMEAPEFTLKGYGGCTLKLGEDSVISLERKSKDGTIQSKVELDASNNVNIEAVGDVSIKAENIYLDGNVKAGPGATDAARSALFGNVVTGGPTGTHPLDFVTGAPILGSNTVKASS